MRIRGFALLCLLSSSPLLAAPPATAPGLGFRQSGYFEMRHDMRKCAAPLCGGYWLKRVNQALTVCSDGRQRAECYVAQVEDAADALLDNFPPVLVRGTLRPRSYAGVDGRALELGVFRVVSGWRPAGPGGPLPKPLRQLHYSGIESSGIVCVMAPCQSLTEYVLNTPRQRLVTGLELAPAGAEPEVEQKARDTVAFGGVLIVRGITRQSEDGTELTVEAQQFFLPVQ